MEQQLVNYIEQECKRGVPENMVKKALRDAGWVDQQIDEAFHAVQSRVTPPVPNSGMIIKEDKPVIMDDDLDDAGGKKKIKPIVAALTVFFVLIVVVGGLVAYFNFMEPADETDNINEFATPENASPATTTTTPVAGESVAKEEAELLAVPGKGIVGGGTASSSEPILAATSTTETEALGRDAQRMRDMTALVALQKKWFDANSKYYTCGVNSGDCKGKLYGYPLQIGAAEAVTSQDPMAKQYSNKKAVCGKDYIYCGLNNTNYSNFFCYYAKLEGGGYYTASHAGNFKRSTPPKIFEECAAEN